MREEYKNILDEVVINDDVINHIDGRDILTYLQVHNVLDPQKAVELYQMGPINCIQYLMKRVLKSRNDKAMEHLLNSLKRAHYDDAYSLLKGKLDNLSLSKLDNPHSRQLDNSDSTLLSDQTDITLKTAWANLKVFYEERLKFVESYWRQFGIKGSLNMETFYNHNIVIDNEKYKHIPKKIENFDDMFSTGYKRIIVMAEAGYGKLTFIDAITQQWVRGDKYWTRKFEFLFLFRLMEVKEKESESLENLLTVCLHPDDASTIHNWFKCENENVSKVLFIFDGLDELRQNFCQEVNEVIFGGKATVVITSRQCEKLTAFKNVMLPKLYIELKEYTDEVVIQQLEKFSIPIDRVKKDLKNYLKIPLFNTIYCIIHFESSVICTNICSSIHRFVHFAMNRYRNSNQSFTAYDEEELLLTLGQAAQNKFSFIEDVEIPYPNVSRGSLLWAVNSGLIHNSSQINDLVFAHEAIAEYCAAYFWCKRKRLVIKERRHGIVHLKEPLNGRFNFTKPFFQFVCLLHPEFKEDSQRKFRSSIPKLKKSST